MLATIVPPTVSVAESRSELPYQLSAAEAAHIDGAVPQRAAEFTTVRACAAIAFRQLGLTPAALVPGPDRAPRWPAGVVGSLTHCDGYRAAAVAKREVVRSIGIDVEPNGPLPEGVADIVLTAAEQRARHGRDQLMSGTNVDRLIFSAKESLFKAWWPLTKTWLDFSDATVTVDPSGTFTAHLADWAAPLFGCERDEVRGRWTGAGSGFVATAVVIAQPAESGNVRPDWTA